MPVGTGQVLEAVRALDVVDVTRRDDFYWALQSVFIKRREHLEVFDLAFRRFWREEKGAGGGLDELQAASRISRPDPPPQAGARRVGEALGEAKPVPRSPEAAEPIALAYSAREALRTKDFEMMSAEELEEAKKVVARLRLGVAPIPTRRYRPARTGGKVDPRATLRASLRAGGAHIPLRWRTRRRKQPPLVVLCDISGSMASYTRMLLHFLHALTRQRPRVHTFLFGTRLTNATRFLRHRDPDESLSHLGATVLDWEGGTRIGHCLEAFNRRWSRRVLAQGAVVLLITDGLDREAGRGLQEPMARLHRSCRRLIWLNPLLRYDEFEARAEGIKAMLPHADDFRTVHNLTSLEELSRVLERPDSRATGLYR